MPSTITRRPVGAWRGAAGRGQRDGRRQQPSADGAAGPLMQRHGPRAGRPCARGGSMPNRRSAVGAMSMIDRSPSAATARLQKNTPGTSRGSMQWSPLHGLGVVLEHRPGDDAGRAVPRDAVAGVVADDAGRARSRGTGPRRAPPCRTPRGRRSRPARSSRRPFSLPMISALSAAASAPGATMPCCSRPVRLRNMPVSPTQ